jgi:membrane protease subunit (stomatin/prohibitin family)
MHPRKLFNWLIALTVAAGLLVAPVSAPAMAALHAMAAADGMQAMAGDMSCCPDMQDHKAQDRKAQDQKAQDQRTKDCGSCPFVALCMLTITMPARDGAGVLVDRAFSRSAFALPDDLLIDGLGEHPPDQPPRSIV